MEVVNLNKRSLRHGVDSAGRILEVLQILAQIRRRRGAVDTIYFNVSESIAGNLKDLAIYCVCLSQLRRMVIHLHGGAGLRLITLGRQGPLRKANEWFLRRLGGAIVLGARHVPIFANVLSPEKIHVVPNFAQDELFVDERTLRRKYSAVSPLRVLYLSNLIPGKGYLELLEAYLALDDQRRNAIHIDFAGEFQSDEEKQIFLRRINGIAQLRYHGLVGGERKRRVLQEAHVFCLPTYFPYEGQPISLLEAYAAGCAVITTDHSGIFDVFTPGVNGYEVAKQSPASISDALRRALGEPERLASMGRANLLAAREHYRTVRFNEQLLHILESVKSS